MKVAIICIAPLRNAATLGGTYSAVLGTALAQDGIDIELWTRTTQSAQSDLAVPVVQGWRAGIFAWLDILRLVQQRKPDIVHLQHYFFLLGNGTAGEISTILLMICLALMRKRVVVTLHDVPGRSQITPEYVKMHRYHYPAWLVRTGLTNLFRLIAAASSALIVHQELFAERLAGFGASRRKTHIISHMPLPSKPMDRLEARRELGLPEDARLVLFFGYATGYKGIENLLDAFASLPARTRPIELLLGAGVQPKVGHTPIYQQYYSKLEAKARATPGVRFVGFIDPSTLDAYISAADVGVLPYLEYHGASGPLYYYLSHGRPVLISKQIAQNTQHVKTGTFDSAAALAASIERFFDDPSIEQKLSIECGKLRESVFSNDYVRATRAVYEEILPYSKAQATASAA